MGQRPRQFRFLALTSAALGLLLVAPGISSAQEPPVPADKPPTQPAPEPAAAKPAADQTIPGEVLPKVYYLKDKDGNLHPVPGFSLEQFIDLYKLKNQLGQQNQQPNFSLQNLTLTGAAVGQHVELVAEYTVVVHLEGWVRVPLRLSGGMLRQQADYQGTGEHFLHFEPDGDGYVSWIRGEPGKTHRVTLRLLAQVTAIGAESHLRLSVPRAAVSHLQLQLPMERAVARVSEGSTLESVQPIEKGKTQLKIVGTGGELDVAWHAADSQVASLPAVLEASGTQLVRIDGRSINTEAKLTVRSSGGDFDRFQVRLPPGADYVETAQAGASLVAVETSAAKGKMYEVKLAKKTNGPVDVRLVTERAHDPQQTGETLELAGFEVAGAVRQWGTVGVQVEGNWQILWGQSNHVRQPDELAGPLRRDDLTAGFEYSAQPYSLTARITPQKTRVRAEGEYVVLVGSDEAQLRARLKYTIRGAKVRSLEVDLPGWEVDWIGPANLVNVDAVNTGETGPLVIPLLQASSGELELSFEARQKISPETASVVLEMPRPRGEAVANANVVVVPADNVEIFMQPDDTSGLAPQPLRPQINELPERQQDPLYFRTTAAAAKLVASVKIYEQSISTALFTQLDVDEGVTRVDQRMTFQIAYQPTDHLALSVPRSIRPDRLTITMDGQRLAPTAIRERPDPDGSDIVPMRVSLPAPRIGRCELQISYVAPHEKLSSAAKTVIGVPLVIPGEGQLTDNELLVAPKTGITANYPKGPWTEDTRVRRGAAPAGLALTAPHALSEVALALGFKARQSGDATTVEQAWIRTRLTDSQRQDRAVYRLTTNGPSVRLSLPLGVDLGSVELKIDNRAVKPDLDLRGESRELVVALNGTSRGEHLLEIRYHFAERPAPGGLSLDAPQIKSVSWVRQLYWQLVLPAHEHLLSAPPNFTREFRWAWMGLGWRRQPSLDQQELESWIGAVPSVDGVHPGGDTAQQSQKARAVSTNQYLFSTMGATESLPLYTLSRARLVLVASLPLLVCGLLLIYFPAARHPAALFVVAVLVAAGSLIDPESAVLLAQASALGLVLATMAALLARISARPSRQQRRSAEARRPSSGT